MNRRLFLQFPLVAGALAAGAETRQDDPPEKGLDAPPKKGFKVGKGQDRYEQELLIMGGQFDCKVSGKDTNGQLCIYDTYREAKGGPGLHVLLHLHPGDAAFGPRKVPHTFANITEGPAQMLVLLQPAGTIEAFFKQMSLLGKDIPKDWEKNMRELMRAHGMELVGPPLKV